MNDQPLDIPARVVAAQTVAAEIGFAMSCENRTGALLRTLAASKPGGRILEVGTGAGAGAAWLLAGMDHTARLVTIEADPHIADAARGTLADDARIEVVTADAADWIARYTGPRFDLAFVDWRVGKFDRRDLVLALLAPGGLYVGDDLHPQPTWPTDHAPLVNRFLVDIVTEPELQVTLLDWASGLVVAARRGPAV